MAGSSEMITDGEIEAAAEALVPFSFGVFEWQAMSDGSRVQPAMQPNDHARRAARAALEAASQEIMNGPRSMVR